MDWLRDYISEPIAEALAKREDRQSQRRTTQALVTCRKRAATALFTAATLRAVDWAGCGDGADENNPAAQAVLRTVADACARPLLSVASAATGTARTSRLRGLMLDAGGGEALAVGIGPELGRRRAGGIGGDWSSAAERGGLLDERGDPTWMLNLLVPAGAAAVAALPMAVWAMNSYQDRQSQGVFEQLDKIVNETLDDENAADGVIGAANCEEAEASVADLQLELEKTKALNSNLTGELASVKDRCLALERELADIRVLRGGGGDAADGDGPPVSDNAAGQSRLSYFEQARRKLQLGSVHSEMRNGRAALRKHAASVKERFLAEQQELEASRVQLEAELATIRAGTEQLRSARATLQSQLDEKVLEHAILKEQSDSLTKRLSEQNQELEGTAALYQHNQEFLAAVQGRWDEADFEGQKERMLDQWNKMKTYWKGLHATHTEQVKRMEEKEAEIHSLVRQTEKCREAEDTVNDKLGRLRGSTKEAQLRLDSLRADLGTATQEKTEVNGEIATVEAAKAAMQGTVDGLRVQLQEAQAKKQQVEAKQTQLIAQLKEATDLHAPAALQTQARQATLDTLQRETIELQQIAGALASANSEAAPILLGSGGGAGAQVLAFMQRVRVETDRLQQQLNEANKRAEDVSGQLAAVNTERTRLSNAGDELHARILTTLRSILEADSCTPDESVDVNGLTDLVLERLKSCRETAAAQKELSEGTHRELSDIIQATRGVVYGQLLQKDYNLDENMDLPSATRMLSDWVNEGSLEVAQLKETVNDTQSTLTAILGELHSEGIGGELTREESVLKADTGLVVAAATILERLQYLKGQLTLSKQVHAELSETIDTENKAASDAQERYRGLSQQATQLWDEHMRLVRAYQENNDVYMEDAERNKLLLHGATEAALEQKADADHYKLQLGGAVERAIQLRGELKQTKEANEKALGLVKGTLDNYKAEGVVLGDMDLAAAATELDKWFKECKGEFSTLAANAAATEQKFNEISRRWDDAENQHKIDRPELDACREELTRSTELTQRVMMDMSSVIKQLNESVEEVGSGPYDPEGNETINELATPLHEAVSGAVGSIRTLRQQLGACQQELKRSKSEADHGMVTMRSIIGKLNDSVEEKDSGPYDSDRKKSITLLTASVNEALYGAVEAIRKLRIESKGSKSAADAQKLELEQWKSYAQALSDGIKPVLLHVDGIDEGALQRGVTGDHLKLLSDAVVSIEQRYHLLWGELKKLDTAYADVHTGRNEYDQLLLEGAQALAVDLKADNDHYKLQLGGVVNRAIQLKAELDRYKAGTKELRTSMQTVVAHVLDAIGGVLVQPDVEADLDELVKWLYDVIAAAKPELENAKQAREVVYAQLNKLKKEHDQLPSDMDTASAASVLSQMIDQAIGQSQQQNALLERCNSETQTLTGLIKPVLVEMLAPTDEEQQSDGVSVTPERLNDLLVAVRAGKANNGEISRRREAAEGQQEIARLALDVCREELLESTELTNGVMMDIRSAITQLQNMRTDKETGPYDSDFRQNHNDLVNTLANELSELRETIGTLRQQLDACQEGLKQSTELSEGGMIQMRSAITQLKKMRTGENTDAYDSVFSQNYFQLVSTLAEELSVLGETIGKLRTEKATCDQLQSQFTRLTAALASCHQGTARLPALEEQLATLQAQMAISEESNAELKVAKKNCENALKAAKARKEWFERAPAFATNPASLRQQTPKKKRTNAGAVQVRIESQIVRKGV